ncbi:unnamed protein product [Symbiodinium natans]|uniref:AMMECR1 domain-containing protein n=1 Tax=Symbiodinium natans TaxID=878477 RepID=A0A812R9B4_9DINO|nr:unnamed protein product [Symbiodinium natans]
MQKSREAMSASLRALAKVEDVPPVTEELCIYCFEVLLARLQGVSAPSLQGPPSSGLARRKVPALFVSWHSPVGLRGCMGSMQPVELERGLADCALSSALSDCRFPPITLKEVKSLTCRVSVLHTFETCQDLWDWKVGLHGIAISFTASFCSICPCSTCRYTATLLPEVILEEGMTQEAALDSAIRKAGYRGFCMSRLMSSVETTRFQSATCDLPFQSFANR